MAIFRPALVIVDFQNDFCPPDGSLAVPGGRDIAPVVNRLLSLPFTLRIATKDWHPRDHVSFAVNHPAPNNVPFESTATIANPLNPNETQSSRLWPVHCVQNTPGAALVSELDTSRLDAVVEKGQDSRVEMYSAFRAPFANPPVAVSELASLLHKEKVTHVFAVGLAYDYCVKCTAVDAAAEGFVTYIIQNGTRAIRNTEADETRIREAEEDMRRHGVGIVTFDGPEVARVKALEHY